MKDKEKQIEEIKNIIVDYTEEYRLSCSKSTLAKMVYEKIIPKDSVVMTKNQIISLEHEWYKIGYEQGSKETAEKIFKTLFESIRYCDDAGFELLYPEQVIELAQQFGVEIKE